MISDKSQSGLSRLSTFLKLKKNKLTLSLGEFNIAKKLGQGGNGIVYEGLFNNNAIALKFLVSDATGNSFDKKLGRFVSEYFNVSLIDSNDSLVKYIDYDVLKINDEYGAIEFPVIIMKKYDSSLANCLVSKNGPDFIKLFKFLIASVRCIHDQGIIHRDLKPENILLDGGNYKLADFGIADYNPLMFDKLIITENKERLGNRLFSAPEQEKTSIAAHATMDIYAIGQLLQWYATGETHRGTGRKRIVEIFPKLGLYDRIIERCLEQDPTKRFQNISEISTFIEANKEKDIFEYLRLFNRICRKGFPRNEYGIVSSSDVQKIDRLLSIFKQESAYLDGTLWWIDGIGSFDQFEFDQKGPGVWKLQESEYNITNLWVSYDSSTINDFVVARYEAGVPFDFEGQKSFSAILVDGKFSISYSEFSNGFAEIGNEVVDLSERNIELIERQDSDGFFILTTAFSCVFQGTNDEVIREFFAGFRSLNRLPNFEEVKSFSTTVRKQKHPEVRNRL